MLQQAEGRELIISDGNFVSNKEMNYKKIMEVKYGKEEKILLPKSKGKENKSSM